MSEIVGHISQVIGPVVDVAFEAVGNEVQLPAINEALSVTRPDGRELIIEVQQHIGENSVRCVAMDSTDGLRRGLEAKATGAPITMPRRPGKGSSSQRRRRNGRWHEDPQQGGLLPYSPRTT